MIKKLIVLLVIILFLGLLGVAWVILGRDSAPSQPEKITALPALINAPGGGMGEITELTVENDEGTFTAYRPGPEDPVLIRGFEEFSLDSLGLFSLFDRAARFTSRGLVSEATDTLGMDAGAFGLDPPRAAIHFRFAGDGAEEILFIGNPAPDGSNTYVKKADGTIHLAYSADLSGYFQGALGYIDTAITPDADEEDAPLFDRIVLGGTVRPGPIVIAAKPEEELRQTQGVLIPNRYRLISPFRSDLGSQNGLGVLHTAFGLKASRVAGRIDGPVTLESFGLTEPYSTLRLEAKNGDMNLRASAPDDRGNVYIMKEGVNLVYQAPRTALPWLEITSFDLIEKMVHYPYIDSLSTVEILTPSGLHQFTLSGGGDNLRVSADGKETDTANFRTFYQTLILAIYDEYNEEPLPAGLEPFLEFIYHYRDGRKEDRVTFYPGSSRRVLTSLNGAIPFYTYAVYTDKVLADLTLILAGVKVTPYI